jgi:hypothetical protein
MEATLHVLAANHGAREFYGKLGWKEDLNAVLEVSTYEPTPKVRYRKKLL